MPAKSQTTHGIPHGEPLPATLPEYPRSSHHSDAGQAVACLPIFCAVLSIYDLQSAAGPRLPVLMPAAAIRPHRALLPCLPHIISNLSRHRYGLHNDGTPFAPCSARPTVNRSARYEDTHRTRHSVPVCGSCARARRMAHATSLIDWSTCRETCISDTVQDGGRTDAYACLFPSVGSL